MFTSFVRHIIFDNPHIIILYFTKQKKFVIILTKSEIKHKPMYKKSIRRITMENKTYDIVDSVEKNMRDITK